MRFRAVGLLLVCAVIGVCLALLAAEGWNDRGGAAAGFHPDVRVDGLIPEFDPSERLYVTRCGPGDAPIRIRTDAATSVRFGSGPMRRGQVRFRPTAAPGDDFRIAITSGSRSREYSARCLPDDFPRWRFESRRPMEDDLFVVSFKRTVESPQWVVVFDTRGAPRWWYRPRTRVLWAQILSDGTVAWPRAFGDGYGQSRRMAHEVRSTTGRLKRLVRTTGSIVDGHELRETGDGRLLVASYVPHGANLRKVGGPRDAAIVAAEVQELDRRGHLLWRWRSSGKLRLGETRLRWWARILANPRIRLGGLQTFDPVHINAIEPRGSEEIVISSRHTDAIYGIRRSSGRIAWKLGGRGRAGALDVIGDPAERRFGGQHDVRVANDGAISVYDNGKLRSYRPRVAFYRLELSRGRARFLDQMRDPLVRDSHCCGSARQLPGGGWLVSWGDNPLVTGFDPGHRIAFRLRLPAPTYRAVPVPSGAVSIAELDRSLERMLRNRPPAP